MDAENSSRPRPGQSEPIEVGASATTTATAVGDGPSKVVFRQKTKRVRMDETDAKKKSGDESGPRLGVEFHRTNSNPNLPSNETKNKNRAYSWHVLASDSVNSASSDSDDYEEIFDPSMVFMAIYRCYNWDSKDRIRKGKMFLTRSELFFKCSGMPFVKVRISYSDIVSIVKLKNYKNGMDQVLSIKRSDNKSFVFYKFRLPKNIIKNMIETLKKESEEASQYDPVANEKDNAKTGIRRISKPFANILAKNAMAAAAKKEEKPKDNKDSSDSSKSSSKISNEPAASLSSLNNNKEEKRTKSKSSKLAAKDDQVFELDDAKTSKLRPSFPKKLIDRFSQAQMEVVPPAERPRFISETHASPSKRKRPVLKSSPLLDGSESKQSPLSPEVPKRVVFPEMISETSGSVVAAAEAIQLGAAPAEPLETARPGPTSESPKEEHSEPKKSTPPNAKKPETTTTTFARHHEQLSSVKSVKQVTTNYNNSKVSYFNWVSVFKLDEMSKQSNSFQLKMNQLVLVLSPLMVILFFGMTILNFLKLESLERQLAEF